MNKHLLIIILCCLYLLAACEKSTLESNDSQNTTPLLLRAIPNDVLIANVTLNGATTTYKGTDFPDGNWIFYDDFEVGIDYAIEVEWLASDILVMEEKGSFVVANIGSIVTPNLNQKTTLMGTNKFDLDCDGKSNLDEINAGSDPKAPNNDSGGDCALEVTVFLQQVTLSE